MLLVPLSLTEAYMLFLRSLSIPRLLRAPRGNVRLAEVTSLGGSWKRTQQKLKDEHALLEIVSSMGSFPSQGIPSPPKSGMIRSSCLMSSSTLLRYGQPRAKVVVS